MSSQLLQLQMRKGVGLGNDFWRANSWHLPLKPLDIFRKNMMWVLPMAEGEEDVAERSYSAVNWDPESKRFAGQLMRYENS